MIYISTFLPLVFDFAFTLTLLQVIESESRSVVSGPHGPYYPWNSLGQNTGVGSCSLLEGIFPTQGSNTGLPHCRQIVYQLSYQGSPRGHRNLSPIGRHFKSFAM